MEEIVVAAGTDPIAAIGNPRMEAITRDIVAQALAALSGRLRAVYVLGSYADASAVPTSDLDLVLVIADRLRNDERARLQLLLAQWAGYAEGEVDIEVEDEHVMLAGVSPTLKLGGRLLWGADVCQRLEIMSLLAWTRDRMHSSYWRLGGLFARPLPLTAPLAYPDPSDEFFGYTRRLTHLPDGQLAPGTRDLMRAVGWMATALVASQAGEYVATKRACALLYREHIGDEWSDLLDDLATWVRSAWHYRVPTAPEARARLRTLCTRTLAFENHFLARYRRYVLDELRGEDGQGREMAIATLDRMPLANAEVLDAKQAAEGQPGAG